MRSEEILGNSIPTHTSHNKIARDVLKRVKSERKGKKTKLIQIGDKTWKEVFVD